MALVALEFGLPLRSYLENADESMTEVLGPLLGRRSNYYCMCVLLLLVKAFCSVASESEREKAEIGERIKAITGRTKL